MTEQADGRTKKLLDELVTGPTSKKSYATAEYQRRRREAKGAEWRSLQYRRVNAVRRAHRRVAADHPEELARVLKQELRREGLT